MTVSLARWTEMHSRLSPVAIALSFFAAVVALRALDLFVLRLDTWPDPTIVSRMLLALLVLFYVRSLRQRIGVVGLHARHLACAVGVGALALLLPFASLYAIALDTLHAASERARIVLGIVDAGGGIVTSAYFLWVYFAGQVVNAFAEEAIFRGIMLPHFMRIMSFRKANLAQASLFAMAHLIWPWSHFALGDATPAQAMSEAVSLLVFTGLGGLIFGYLYYRTNSLWTPLLTHLIDNSVWLFVHIETSSRFDAESDVSLFGRAIFCALVLVAWFVATRSGIEVLRPWTAATRL